jgi:hypothetical protein
LIKSVSLSLRFNKFRLIYSTLSFIHQTVRAKNIQVPDASRSPLAAQHEENA